jgi:RNA polymerase sigma-70 factor (ECF subfamily)
VTVTVADGVTIGGEPRALAGTDHPDVLVAAARTGDLAAFDRLVELHESAALRTAMAALGRREDAEDVVQDAFVLAWRRLPGFRGDATFRTWLLTIVWRRALDRRKARSRWWRRSAAWDPEDVSLPQIDSGGLTPERQTIEHEARQAIRRAIAALPPKLRDALLLAADGEHTYEDIARMQRVRPGTIKWRVFEARRIVRARLTSIAGFHE